MSRPSRQVRFERTITKFIRHPPAAMYDIGVGPKSEWSTLSQEYPEMLLFGCEPHPVIRTEVIDRGFPGPVWPVAIGDAHGTAILYEPPGNIGGASILQLANVVRSFRIDTWTLDEFDCAAGAPERILLWMDIEGSELSALKGGIGLLKSGRVRWINLEERRNGDRPASNWAVPQELEDFLSEYRFRRQCAYNRHSTHHDVIYVHESESFS